jgi:uncharacterized iron-regulated protein
MKRVQSYLAAGVVLWATSFSLGLASVVWSEFDGDVLILGEYHDNPHHHARQQNAVTQISPKAVVFEMLTPDEAAQLQDTARTKEAMTAATDGFHWSNIADYAHILASSDVIIGAALPREDMRKAFTEGAAAVFGTNAADYGLTDPLPEAEQSAREQLQFAAHCEAMPLAMMGGMVEAQRLRDASFARAVLQAIDTYGAPVILITGNGHARTDWGVPAYLARVRPDLVVESVGQGEARVAPEGTFSWVHDHAFVPEREDPCKAFQ